MLWQRSAQLKGHQVLTNAQTLLPEFAWPVKFSAGEARALVNRRLKQRTELNARLYHHPFLGLVFEGQQHRPGWLSLISGGQQREEIVRAHVLVDLVGGRAYLSDAWKSDDFVALGQDEEVSPISNPEPHIDEATAMQAARGILANVVLRRRRPTAIDRLELVERPLRLGKPNWWVTDRNGTGAVEVIVDGITGKHYAFAA